MAKETDDLTRANYRVFVKVAPRFRTFKQIYQKSGLSRPYEAYPSLMLLASVLAFIFSFLIGAVIHHMFFNLTLYRYLIALIAFSGVFALLVPLVFVTYPLFRHSQRKKEIDTNLVYTAGYMGVLSAGGLSIERIFDQTVQVEPRPAIRDLVKRFIANIKIFGLDVTAALDDVRLRSPSGVFSKLLMSISNTVKTSGDLKSLLSFETKKLLGAKQEQLKRTLNTLVTFAEVYLTAMVMGPIVFIVMLTILSIMGNVAFGLSPAMQMNLVVFLGLPALSVIFIVILNGVLPEEE